MKRLLMILLCLLLLTGCAGSAEPTVSTTEPTQITTAPTEPPVPWIEELGTPWDDEGALLELPLTIHNGLHYDNALAFDGDLLLWSIDDHRENTRTLELCLVELDTGKVIAEREFPFEGYVNPQVLGESIFLCDNESGAILELNHSLEAVNSWKIEPVEGNVHMGAEEKAYIYQWSGSLLVQDLATGEKSSLMEEDSYVDYFSPNGNTASFDYFHPVTGEKETRILDLTNGQILEVGLDKDLTYITGQDGTWLCENFLDGSVFYLGNESQEFLRADMGYDSLRLLDGKTLLRTWEDGCHISLHDLEGRSLAQAKITGNPYSQSCTLVIPSDTFGGYFLLIGDYGNAQRLLYWDTSKGTAGEDIVFEPIPTPEEEEARIRQRVEEIELTYGLNILVGEDCGTSFYDFSAEQVTDWDLVDNALDTLEDALEDYPAGFFPQLRYGDIRSVEIHLAGTLTATNTEYVDTYEAFFQEEYDKHVMVVDVTMAREQTYYHEFSHIIDAFLAWDSWNREGALFSDEDWENLNPGWFSGYTWDYSWEQYVEDYSCFIDSYSTIKPTEDRARVLEYAMAEYNEYFFEEDTVLLDKLTYYCRCIRDAFDTTGWPEDLLWEQYLP